MSIAGPVLAAGPLLSWRRRLLLGSGAIHAEVNPGPPNWRVLPELGWEKRFGRTRHAHISPPIQDILPFEVPHAQSSKWLPSTQRVIKQLYFFLQKKKRYFQCMNALCPKTQMWFLRGRLKLVRRALHFVPPLLCFLYRLQGVRNASDIFK